VDATSGSNPTWLYLGPGRPNRPDEQPQSVAHGLASWISADVPVRIVGDNVSIIHYLGLQAARAQLQPVVRNGCFPSN